MSVINQEQTNNLLIILPPSLPNLSGFPHRGRSTARSFSPLGETGKGVIKNSIFSKSSSLSLLCKIDCKALFILFQISFPRFPIHSYPVPSIKCMC